jgi:hypothetical protein
MVRGRSAQFDPEGDGSERIGDLDPPIPRCGGSGGALLPELVDGFDGFGAGLREVGNLDPNLVGNEIVSVHEMVALHQGRLAFVSGVTLGGVSRSQPRS